MKFSKNLGKHIKSMNALAEDVNDPAWWYRLKIEREMGLAALRKKSSRNRK